MIDILVTMPAFNEQESVGQVVREIDAVLQGERHSIIVIDDGSTDNTGIEANAAGAIVCYKHHGGVADAFRYEMKVAAAIWPNVIVHTDADGQFDAMDIPRMVEAVRQGSDLVLGSRLSGDADMTIEKRVLNTLGAWGMRQWLREGIADATTGLRAFRPEVALLPIKNDHSYTLEQLIRAKQMGFHITSIGARCYKRRHGTSKVVQGSHKYIWRTISNWRRMIQ